MSSWHPEYGYSVWYIGLFDAANGTAENLCRGCSGALDWWEQEPACLPLHERVGICVVPATHTRAARPPLVGTFWSAPPAGAVYIPRGD